MAETELTPLTIRFTPENKAYVINQSAAFGQNQQVFVNRLLDSVRAMPPLVQQALLSLIPDELKRAAYEEMVKQLSKTGKEKTR